MTTNQSLPPGVSAQLYAELPHGTLFYDAEGTPGLWADPKNWWTDVVAGPNSTVLIPVDATLNGPVAVRTLMMLGAETVTVNGALTTKAIGPCDSFMVCDDAVANFTAGSALHDLGGLIVGNEDAGTLDATDAALNTVATKIGRFAEGAGSVTLDGGHWTNGTDFYVGMSGAGTLTMGNGAQLSVGTNFVVGRYAGAQGQVALSGAATLQVGGDAKIGGGDPGIAGGAGAGTLSLGADSSLTVAGALGIFADSSLTLAGGAATACGKPQGVNIRAGGTLCGYGTVSSSSAGITDNGTITASGGTLALAGTLSGAGRLCIGAAATLQISSATLGKNLAIAFIGPGATLDLAHGVADAAPISGFAPGDTIDMPDIDHLAWNANTDILTLSDAGKTIDTLKFTAAFPGAFPGDSFTLTQSGPTALITLTPHS